MTTDQLICLQGAGVRSADKWLVSDINLSVSLGEIVTLVGPNGGGKSTTVKMALGLIKATVGEVWRMPDLSVGYMPQKLSINWTMPMSVTRFMSLTHKLSDSACDMALSRVGAEKLKSRNIQSLSGGEFQRVLLARAIAAKPDLLVLDEPVQGVDFVGEAQMYDLITAIRDETKCGVLMISHDLHVVMASTDVVICLNGHVCCHGRPDVVRDTPEYLAFRGNTGSHSHALYRHHHDHHHHGDLEEVQMHSSETGAKHD